MPIRFSEQSLAHNRAGRLLRTGLLVSVALSVSLAACVGQRSAAVDPTPTGAIANPTTTDEINTALAYWDARYAEDPDNRNNAYYYATVLKTAQTRGIATHIAEREVLGFGHEEIGGQLAREWQFAETYLHTILYHHKPKQAASSTPS